jgi:hypothetical protein
MVELVLCATAFALLLGGIVGLVGRIRYRVTATHLEVRLLGLRLRKIHLTDILRVSKRRRSFCEAWPNTFQTRKRVLVLARRTGWVKYFLITPEHRYVFKHQLKQAMTRARGGVELPVSREDQDEDEAEEAEGAE